MIRIHRQEPAAPGENRPASLPWITGEDPFLDAMPEGFAPRDSLADWWRLRRVGSLPCLADLEFHRAPAQWHNRILLLQDIEPSRSVFIYCGPGAGVGFDRSVVTRSLEDVVPQGAGAIVDACVASVYNETPAEAMGTCRVSADRLWAYRAIFAPVIGARTSDRYAAHGYLLGALEWYKVAA